MREQDRLPRLPQRGHYTAEARRARLDFVRQATGANLSNVGVTSLQDNQLRGNIEAFIGSVEVPIGIAGPLRINGDHAQGDFYAPIATTEGALVSSVTRGAKALSLSDGVNVSVSGQRMIRSPLFELNDMDAARFLADWLRCCREEIKAKAEGYSHFAKLVELNPQVLGRSVHVHFIYETGDAGGQNMTTTCTWKACLWIQERLRTFKHIQIRNFVIEANLSSYKKVSHLSFINGRGVRCQAEAMISGAILRRILKVSTQQLCSTYQGFIQGSFQAGMVGMNINVANVIAGIFTATGQDIACVHECSTGHLHLEASDDGIYASMQLPGLILGTVGGGTGLPQQRECLELLGCVGAGKVKKLAEIIVGYCLALDLSTLAAIASGQFALAHEKLGRNRPVDFLSAKDFTPEFFNRIICNTRAGSPLRVLEVVPKPKLQVGSSIITELSAQGISKLVGHLFYDVAVSDSTDKKTETMLVKSKPTDAEVVTMLTRLVAGGGAELAANFEHVGSKLDFPGCHLRELAICAQQYPAFKRYLPKVYGIHQDDQREVYLLVMERLQDMVLMDTAEDVSAWTAQHIRLALDGLAELHSVWLGRADQLMQQPWLNNQPTLGKVQDAERFWDLLAQQAHDEFPHWFLTSDLKASLKALKTLPDWWQPMDAMPKTLIHNDFNPRNIAFRQVRDELRLCVYDWELATLHIPQHDLAELLIFVLDENTSLQQVKVYVEYFRMRLQSASGQSLDADLWWQGFRSSLNYLLINRVAMYIIAHVNRHYGFIERVFATLRHLRCLMQL